MKCILALLLVLSFALGCGGGGSSGGGNNGDIGNGAGWAEFPPLVGGVESFSEYSTQSVDDGWTENAELWDRRFDGVSETDYEAFIQSLADQGFIPYPRYEKVIGDKRYAVESTYTKAGWLSLKLYIIEDVPEPHRAPRMIVVTPAAALENVVSTPDAGHDGQYQYSKVSVLETGDGSETTYTINYNPTGSQATCTSVELDDPDNLVATVALTAGITTWTTKITRMEYTTEIINKPPAVYPAYMICDGNRIPVDFLGKTVLCKEENGRTCKTSYSR